MHSLILLSLCIALLQLTVSGIDFPNIAFRRNFDVRSVPSKPVSTEYLEDTLFSSSERSEVYNSSEYRAEGNYAHILTNNTTSPTENTNSTLSNGNQSQTSTHSTSSVPSTSNIRKMETLTDIFSNKSNSQSSIQYSSSESSAPTSEGTKSSGNSTTLVTPSNHKINDSSADNDETEGVARGKPSSTESSNTTTSQTQTIYQKTLALISDTYTLSILVPVAAGVVFATTIMVTIAICRCMRRRCMRRRLCKKSLPDSVKNLRPSDRARLLAESSDEEF